MTRNTDDDGIVVLGHPRSGTTLLRRLINLHPNISSPPETHLLSACARFLDADMTADGVDMGVLAGLDFSGFSESDVLKELRQFSFGFLQRIAERKGKARWAEKTAFDIFHLKNIEKLCEDHVYYVAIVRHPLDVAVSCTEFCTSMGTYPSTLHEYIKRYPQPIEAFAMSWLETTKALMDLGRKRSSRFIMVRYEDIIEDENEIMNSVFQFVDEEHGCDQAQSIFNSIPEIGFSDHKSLQEKSIHKKSIDRWRSLPSPQVKRLGELLNPLLAELGYDEIENTGEIGTTAARRRYATSLALHAAKTNETDDDTKD
ncbi:sulfotransferase family protein [Kiloniella antarctica]|uniref:Sulfotransferase family protein n=1 Tax=Kiloniella antarctica TaxID=1550907 RepID=A0ABW5BMF7_9PROT